MAEQATREMVKVKCCGIVGRQTFCLTPEGLEPEMIVFNAAESTEMAKPYADYLCAQDPARFFITSAILESDKQAAPTSVPRVGMSEGKAAKKSEKSK